MSMFMNAITVKEKLDVQRLIEVISDVLHRYSKTDPSVQQPLRTILPIDQQEKYRTDLIVSTVHTSMNS